MLVSAVIGFDLISAFASLVGIPIGIKSYAVRLRICAINTGIKKIIKINKSIIKNRNKSIIK